LFAALENRFSDARCVPYRGDQHQGNTPPTRESPMSRKHTAAEPQPSLPAVVACAHGMTRRVYDEQLSKTAVREAPPSA